MAPQLHLGLTAPSLKLLTLNVNGLLNTDKQADLLAFLIEGPWNVICLQDTHFTTVEQGERWLAHGLGRDTHASWQGTGFFTRTSSPHVGGVAVLFKTSFPGSLVEGSVRRSEDPHGRCLRVDFNYEGSLIALFSVYVPVQPHNQGAFFTAILSPLVEAAHHDGAALLLGGDWNCCPSPLDFHPADDLTRMQGYPALRVIEDRYGLQDVWRYVHGGGGSLRDGATFVSRGTGSLSRLDRWLMSAPLCTRTWVHSCDIALAPRADHMGVSLYLHAPRAPPRGSGLWTLPLHVLDDTAWMGQVREEWEARVQEPLSPGETRRRRWDAFKVWVKFFTIKHCQQRARERRRGEKKLEKQIRRAVAALAAAAPTVDTTYWRGQYAQACAALDEHHRTKSQLAAVQAGVVWQDYGERPTHLFHQLARKRATDSSLRAVQRPGSQEPPLSLCDSAEERGEAVEFVAATFSGDAPSGLYRARPTSPAAQAQLLQHTPSRLGADGVASCTGSDSTGAVTLEECTAALDALARGKRPGVDGLPAEFYRTFWDMLGQEVVEVFNEAFMDPSAQPLLSASQRMGCTVLLYKGDGPRDLVSNYRPITLLNADYKILAKLLATRMGAALGEIIDPTQTAFVPGRWIGENILAHLDECDLLEELKDVPGAMVFTDFSKAYDTLDRGWLRRCLEHMGFPACFRRWVDLLLADNLNRVMVNGWLSAPFPLYSGVRQGCPASPPLYIVATQPLAAHMRALQQQGILRPIPLPLPLEISWQHADDLTLHLDPATVRAALEEGLQPFSAASGQQLNLNKCKVIAFNTDTQPLEQLGLHVVAREVVTRHLGVPLGAGVSPSAFCMDVVQRVKRRAAMWSTVQLSLLGRVYVAKQELMSMLVHILSFLPLPDAVFKEAWSIITHFIMRGKAPSAGARSHVVRPPIWMLGLDWQQGGCRAAHLEAFSCALQAKVMALLLQPTRAPWKRLMVQWWHRAPSWYDQVGGAVREVDRWEWGNTLPLTAFPLNVLRNSGVPARVLSYLKSFHDLQLHRPTTPLEKDGLHVGREPLFYNRLVVDDRGVHITPAHATWGILAREDVRVTRVEHLQAKLQDATTPPEVRAACESMWQQAVPACFRLATAAMPHGTLPKGTWVGVNGGPIYCLEDDAHHQTRPLVPAKPHRMLQSGMLKVTGPPTPIEPFSMPLLSVVMFEPKRSKAVSDKGGEQPFLLGPLGEDPGSLRGWQLGGTPLFSYTVREASMRFTMMRFKEMCAVHHLPSTLPAQPALWGEGLNRLDAQCKRETAIRVLGNVEQQQWQVDQGPAWMRAAPPRAPPPHRRNVVHRAERDWALDPLADLVPAEAPPWSKCWQDIRESRLRRPHRSTAYLLLHGALPVNGMAFLWRWRDDSSCPHTCCTREDVPLHERPVETYTHAFLSCPVAHTVTTWLVRLMGHMDGTTPPRTAAVIMLGSKGAWTPMNKDLQWVWLHLRVACLHHLFTHRDAVALHRHPSSPFAVIGAVIADLRSTFLMDQRRLSKDAYHLPGVCADWLRGPRKLFTKADFIHRWRHSGLATYEEAQPPRFLLSMHAPIPAVDCVPPGHVFT